MHSHGIETRRVQSSTHLDIGRMHGSVGWHSAKIEHVSEVRMAPKAEAIKREGIQELWLGALDAIDRTDQHPIHALLIRLARLYGHDSRLGVL
eukprot:3172309-Pleurochrysis_carterae.AAC.3